MSRKGSTLLVVLFIVVGVLAVGGILYYINHQSISINSPTPSNPQAQRYQGLGFSFDYPASWKISAVGDPSKNLSACGDAWNSAVSCVSLDPPELAQYMRSTISVLVYHTTTTPIAYCQSRSDVMSDCQAVTSTAAIAGTPSGDYPAVRYELIAQSGTLLIFQVGDPSQYPDAEAVFDEIINAALCPSGMKFDYASPRPGVVMPNSGFCYTPLSQ